MSHGRWWLLYVVAVPNNGHIVNSSRGGSKSGHHNHYLRFFPNACTLSMAGNRIQLEIINK